MEALELVQKECELVSKVDELVFLRSEQNRLADRIKELSDDITSTMQKYGVDEVPNYDYSCKVTLCARDSWTYSDKLSSRYEKLKLDRKREQLSGIATSITNYYLRVK